MNNSNYFNFKKVLLMVFLSVISLLASAQEVTFTDSIFRQAVTANPFIDLNDDGLIQLTEAAAFNGTIDVSNLGISELTGIEAFTSLYSLNCNYNLLTYLDVSAINSLVVLNCLSNSLTSINVSNNTNLFELNCSNNFLTSIDVSALSSLNLFYCYNNLLFSLDVSNNPLLFTLYCFQNQLSTIDVSANTALNSLYCGNNLFTSVDVSNNASLAFFSIEGNNINTVDLSSNINLYYFICSNTTITNLDLTGLNSLTYLNASNCGPITNITFPSAALMNHIEIQGNQLSGINVSSYTGLNYLNVSNNLFTALDLTSNSVLKYVSCIGNQITSLDLSNADSLTELFCNNNQLQSLNIQNGNNINLVSFNATGNPNLSCIQVDDATFMNNNWAGAIDATANYNTNCNCVVNIPDANFKAALLANTNINTNADAEIQCNEATAYSDSIFVNNLNIADLTGIESFVNIILLVCNSNQLTSLDISANTNLAYLDCGSNQLSTLNVSTNTALTTLGISSNSITNIDLSNNTILESLSCQGNQLISLDLSANTSLTYLDCSANFLTTLDVSSNTALAGLYCYSNLLNSLNIQNGNNLNFTAFQAFGNSSLTCVQVDDVTFMNTNWSAAIDASASYSSICNCVVNIPDANFKAALLANILINTNADAEIQCGEASIYNGALNVSNLSIADLTGIEAFIGIDTLICTDNSLTSLDVSANTSLIYLCFSNNQLSTIDLSSNTQLIEVCGQFNQLSAIDVSANTALKYLYLSSNQLSSLNVSANVALWYLSCSINNLSSLDVTNCIQLLELNCSNNQISSLDLSNNTDMYYVYCDNNLLTSIDLSSDTSLVILNCNNNNLSNLNIQNGNNIDLTTFNATNNPNLTCVQVDDVTFMNTNWAAAIDATASYSLDCDPCDALPVPQFTLSSNNITSSPATVVFTNSTPNLGLYDFLWHFGDGSAMNNDNATVNYTYNTNGNFEISLTLNDPATGCSVTNYDPANAVQTVVCNVPSANICGFTPIINPSGLINACLGSNVELNLNAGSYPSGSTIQWNKDGVTVIGENYTNHFVTEDGYYTVTVFGPNGCPVVSDPVQVQYNLPATSAPSISVVGTSGPCGQINLTLTASGSFGTYLWNNGQTGASINVTQAGVYQVIGQGGTGCNFNSAPYAVSTSSFATPEICMVDVDSLTNHAVIIWEKPIMNGILGFGIYKETPLYSENYQQIAIVPYDSLSEYMDISSDESVISERYRISIIDSCNGGETSYSNPARAMGLKVLPGVGFQRVLTWNYYVSSTQNFTNYKIYSGASINQLSLLATVPASINSNYIDANPVNGVNTVYKIYADMLIPCESTRIARNRSQSNGTGNFLTSYTNLSEIEESNNFDYYILPNPSNGLFSLVLTNTNLNDYTIQIFDMLGNIVYHQQYDNANKTEIDLSNLARGVYNIRLNMGSKQLNKRLLITK